MGRFQDNKQYKSTEEWRYTGTPNGTGNKPSKDNRQIKHAFSTGFPVHICTAVMSTKYDWNWNGKKETFTRCNTQFVQNCSAMIQLWKTDVDLNRTQWPATHYAFALWGLYLSPKRPKKCFLQINNKFVANAVQWLNIPATVTWNDGAVKIKLWKN